VPVAFRTKDFLSIVGGMINWMRGATDKVTDYRIGSVTRTMLEAPAIEIDELYQNMLRGLVDGIPVAIYQGFGFERLPAAAAAGIVTFSVDAPATDVIVIPAGTVVGTSDQQITFVTLVEVTIGVGETSVSVSVACTEAGLVGNVVSGQISVVVSGPGGIDVTNAAPISSGRDEESDEQRAARFLEYIRSLSRGPLASIEYGLKQAAVRNAEGVVIERVVSSRCIEGYLLGAYPPGYVDCYVWNGGAGASPELIAEAQRVVDGYRDTAGNAVLGWKAAGVVARVYGVELRSVAVTAVIGTRDGVLTAAQLQALADNIGAYINDVAIGGTVFIAGMTAAAMRVPNVLDAKFLPDADIATSLQVKAVVGAMSFTATQVSQ
jgi:hypothetical protein